MTLEKEPRSVPSLLIAAEIGCRASYGYVQGSTGTAQEPIVRGSPLEYRNQTHFRVTGEGAYRVLARVTYATLPMLLPIRSFIHSFLGFCIVPALFLIVANTQYRQHRPRPLLIHDKRSSTPAS